MGSSLSPCHHVHNPGPSPDMGHSAQTLCVGLRSGRAAAWTCGCRREPAGALRFVQHAACWRRPRNPRELLACGSRQVAIGAIVHVGPGHSHDPRTAGVKTLPKRKGSLICQWGEV